MTELGIVILSAGFVAAVCALLAFALLRAVGKTGKMVSDVQEGQSRILRTVTLRLELLECEVRASAWQALYLFAPESPDYDYSDYVMERLDEALDDYKRSGKKLRELEYRWEFSDDCLMERTNAFRLIRSIVRRAPSGASGDPGGSDGPTVTEGGACAVGQGPRHERSVEPDSKGGVS